MIINNENKDLTWLKGAKLKPIQMLTFTLFNSDSHHSTHLFISHLSFLCPKNLTFHSHSFLSTSSIAVYFSHSFPIFSPYLPPSTFPLNLSELLAPSSSPSSTSSSSYSSSSFLLLLLLLTST